MKSSPFVRANFEKAIADLEMAYKEMKKPLTKEIYMFDWTRHLRNTVDAARPEYRHVLNKAARESGLSRAELSANVLEDCPN